MSVQMTKINLKLLKWVSLLQKRLHNIFHQRNPNRFVVFLVAL